MTAQYNKQYLEAVREHARTMRDQSITNSGWDLGYDVYEALDPKHPIMDVDSQLQIAKEYSNNGGKLSRGKYGGLEVPQYNPPAEPLPVKQNLIEMPSHAGLTGAKDLLVLGALESVRPSVAGNAELPPEVMAERNVYNEMRKKKMLEGMK